MIKVLHLINYPGTGGTEKYILTLAKGLHNKQCRFYLAHSLEGGLVKELEKIGIEFFKIPMKNSMDIRAATELRNICRKYSIDLVHTHFLRENCISVLSKVLGNNIKLINTRHMLKNNTKAVKFTNRTLSHFIFSFIAVSSAVKNLMTEEGIPAKKISLIYNGVDLDYWDKKINSSIRNEFNISSSDFVVTCVARFSQEKGHDFLIDTIENFNELNNRYDNYKNVKFLLVGDGELLEGFKKRVEDNKKCNNIIFTGYRKDIREILNESNLYVSPSQSEALGISIIEALACGVPAIATNTGGQTEILKGSNCGLIINYGDTEGFTNALFKMIYDQNFYNDCKHSTKKTVAERFSSDNMVMNTYKIYEAAAK